MGEGIRRIDGVLTCPLCGHKFSGHCVAETNEFKTRKCLELYKKALFDTIQKPTGIVSDSAMKAQEYYEKEIKQYK